MAGSMTGSMKDEDNNGLGRIIFAKLDEVDEVPISSRTNNPKDQGGSRALISKAVNGAPDLLVSVLRMQPGQYHPTHSHPNMGELYYVLEGRCEIRVGDEVQMCSAGTAIYTPAGTPHSVRTHDEGTAVMVAFPEGDWEKIVKVWHEDHDQAG
jgi:quercetin dioxygenase-like cupin family protein